MMVIRLLRNIPYFSELTIEEMQKLVARSQQRGYPRGSIVLHQGDVGDVLYLIVKGRVKIIVADMKLSSRLQ